MIRHARLWAAGALALATCLGSLAVAQPKKGGPTRPKPKPPAAAAADGAAEAVAEDKERPAASSDSGTASSTAPESFAGDGSARPSPLNPASGEMPGPVDAGAAAVDYERLLADLSALRTRVAAVGEGLFQARMNVSLRLDGDRARVAKVHVSVDDGVVYTSPQGFRGEDATPVFARALAPGRHAVTVDIEREDKENAAFRSAQRSRFIVEVTRDAQLDVELRLEDDSSMGNLPAKQSGEYDLRVRMRANSRPIKR